MTNQEILDSEFESTDLDKTITIRDFFKELLKTLFEDKKLLDGSHWYCDLCTHLAQCGAINGEASNNCGFTVWSYDSKEAEDKILELIKEL